MTRLYVICEGLTEVTFVSQVLKPHLEKRVEALSVSAPRLGGGYRFAWLKKFVKNLLGAPGSDVLVTTMIDLFRVAPDYPGVSEGHHDGSPLNRVRYLEECCRTDIGDGRFLPYLQLHEFEALVLADLTILADYRPSRRTAIQELAARLDREFTSPEHVNSRQPPSYRILAAVPEYQKTTDGILTVTRIGLPKLRERCSHFGSWVNQLEAAGVASYR